MTPASGAYGSTITISGSGFGATGTLAFDQASSGGRSRAGAIRRSSRACRSPRWPARSTSRPMAAKPIPPCSPRTMPWLRRDGRLADGARGHAARDIGAAVLGVDATSVELAGRVRVSGHPTTTVLDGVADSTDDRHPTPRAPRARRTRCTGRVRDERRRQHARVRRRCAGQTGLVGTVMAAGRRRDGAVLSGCSYERQLQLARAPARRRSRSTADRSPMSVRSTPRSPPTARSWSRAATTTARSSTMSRPASASRASHPRTTAFVIGETAGTMAWDDYIAAAHLRISPDGARMFATYSTQQNNENQDHARRP